MRCWIALFIAPAIFAAPAFGNDCPDSGGGDIRSFLGGCDCTQDTVPCDRYVISPLTLSVTPGRSLGFGRERCRVNVIGANLFGGCAGKLRGVEASLVANTIAEDAVGLQVAGLANVAAEGMYGAQFAGLANAVVFQDDPMATVGRSGGIQFAGLANALNANAVGVQVAGLANVASGSFYGAQLSFLANVAVIEGFVSDTSTGRSNGGLQFAGLANVAAGSFYGAQMSFLANVAAPDDMDTELSSDGYFSDGYFGGLQVAGLANVAGGNMVGVQFAGLANGTGGHAHGVQLALAGNGAMGGALLQVAGIGNHPAILRCLGIGRGRESGIETRESFVQIAGISNHAVISKALQIGFWNSADTSRGVQLGVYNTSKHVSGFPIGIVNRVPSVPFRWAVSASEIGLVSAQLRSGTPTWRSVATVGFAPLEDPSLLAYGIGFGPRIELPGGKTWLDVNTIHRQLVRDGDWLALHMLETVEVRAGRRLTPRLALTVGLTLNTFISNVTDGSELAPYTLVQRESGDTNIRVWPGLTLGVEF